MPTFHQTLEAALDDAHLPRELLEVRIFGSARREADPEDIDLLLVYEDGHAAEAMRTIAATVRQRLEPRLDRPLDLLLLSRSEVDQTQFDVLEDAQLVWHRSETVTA